MPVSGRLDPLGTGDEFLAFSIELNLIVRWCETQGLHVMFSGIDGSFQSRFLRGGGGYRPFGFLTAD